MTDQTNFRLNKISKIKNYFNSEINQKKPKCSKKLSKYVAAFDYIDKVLIVLSARSSGVCIISSVSIVGAPIGIAGASFTLIFSVTTGIIKKLLSMTRYKKKKHDKILMLAKSKLNSIETVVFQALNREEFIMVLKENDKYEKMKENVRNVNEKQENMRSHSVNSRTQKNKWMIGDFNRSNNIFLYI